ncbi:hypothetical protein HAX54_038757, partial [Datura stramonium]|nr:hypothetical protein [Datura stramonium]
YLPVNSTSPATVIFSFFGAARSRLFRSAARDSDDATERLNGDLRDWFLQFFFSRSICCAAARSEKKNWFFSDRRHCAAARDCWVRSGSSPVVASAGRGVSRSIWAALLLAICYGGCSAFPSPVDCAAALSPFSVSQLLQIWVRSVTRRRQRMNGAFPGWCWSLDLDRSVLAMERRASAARRRQQLTIWISARRRLLGSSPVGC